MAFLYGVLCEEANLCDNLSNRIIVTGLQYGLNKCLCHINLFLKWKVKGIFVKDVPNNQLRHIRLENNDNKPVTNSRDTQEVPLEKAKQVLKIIASYKHTTSIFDDFSHYEKRQEEEEVVRKVSCS